MKILLPALEKLWPRLFLFAVLGLFCTVAIHKASLAIAPPVYDGLSYYWKAISMLRAIEAGQGPNLMATEPTMRPPGFLLLNGVFGIHRDVFNFHGFFALNMILPVLLWSLACWIAIPLRRFTARLLWRKSITVAALSLLPMFLQFEFSENIRLASYWGMQDTLLSACAALALALVMHSLRRRHLISAVAGFALSGFTIFIKPAGILLMLSVTGAWILGGAVRWMLFKSLSRRRMYQRYFLKTLLSAACIQAAFFSAAFFSAYFSKEIIEVSVRNQSALVSTNQTQDLWEILATALLRSFGTIWSVFFLVAILSSVALLFRSSKRRYIFIWTSVVPVTVILAASFYWWIYMSGTLARYILPFFCLAIILSLPVLWSCWMNSCSARGRSLLLGFFISIIIIYSTAIVWPGGIPACYQLFLGINVSTGGHRSSVEAAEFLSQKSRQFDRPVSFLQAEMDHSLAFIASWLVLANLKKEDSFKIDSSFDWKPEKTIPKFKVINYDFIALRRCPRPQPSEISSLAVYWEEVFLLTSWFASLDEDSGIQRHSFGEIDLLEVVDRNKFSSAFDALVQSKASLWRPEFLEKNGYLATSWQNNDHARTSFSVTGTNLGETLLGSHDLEESSLKKRGHCMAIGIDPYFLLKPIFNHGASKARIRIQLVTTAPGPLQIFYSGQANAFSEDKSVWLRITKGFCEAMVDIPIEGETTWLRIDFAGPPAETVIEKLSITLLNPTESPFVNTRNSTLHSVK